MVTTIGLDSIKTELLNENKPVLVACISSDVFFAEIKQTLENISYRFAGVVKIYLLNQNSLNAFCAAYDIDGTPTFLIMNHGKELDRFMGEADESTLVAIIQSILPSFQRK